MRKTVEELTAATISSRFILIFLFKNLAVNNNNIMLITKLLSRLNLNIESPLSSFFVV